MTHFEQLVSCNSMVDIQSECLFIFEWKPINFYWINRGKGLQKWTRGPQIKTFSTA